MKQHDPAYRATELVASALAEQGRRKDWLAEIAGISAGHVTRVLKNERGVSERVARRIAGALGLPFFAAFVLPNGSNPLHSRSDNEEAAA